MYSELLGTSLLLNFFDAVLTALAAFSLSYFLIYFFRFTYWIAIGIGVGFFIRSLILKIKQNKILVIEKKYPNMRERLRTSYDHQSKSNYIIDSLHNDIAKRMRKVDVNAYLNIKTISFKVMIVSFMLFSVLYFSSVGLDILDISTRITNSDFYDGIKGKVEDAFDTRIQIINRPRLDEPRLLSLGENDFNLSIETYNTELDITDISGAEKNDFGGHYPDEVKGAAQEVYEEGIPEEYKEIIKTYFKKINQD